MGPRVEQISGMAWTRLATVTSIDATSTGTTNLFTVPTGKTGIISVLLECTSATGFTSVATAGVGIAAGEDDIHASVALTGLNAAGKVWRFDSVGITRTAPAGSVIKLGIDTAAVATTQVITAYVLGMLY